MAPLARGILWCLRGAAQVPRHLPRRLRKLRKSRGIYRDVCASCASTAAFTETFAQAAQVLRHLPRRLRKLRKYRGIYRDVCASRAGSHGECFGTCTLLYMTLVRYCTRCLYTTVHDACTLLYKVLVPLPTMPRGVWECVHTAPHKAKMSVRWRLAFFLTNGGA